MKTPSYFWEENIDGNLYVYMNTKDRDGIVFGRTPPLCLVPNRHGAKKMMEIADFIVNALNERETPNE
jgi:hypothetical protein